MTLESKVQADIEVAIGADQDVLLLRNSVGMAKYYGADGRLRMQKFGLGVGSPDLIIILAPHGRVVGLEVKVPGEKPDSHQEKCHAIWRHFGAFIATVHSVEEARAALARARAESEPS